MTKNTWNTFVEARYAGLVKAGSTVVGKVDATDVVPSAIPAVPSVAANNRRGGKTQRAMDPKRLDRQVAIQAALDLNIQKEVEAQRIFDAETAAMLARVRATRKPKPN